MSIAISASEVNKLRQQTGAGMMDCRKALVETEGDFEAAIDWLRKKGQKVAANRSDREAKEGVVVAKADGNYGIIVALSSETDFVSKNEDFVAFTNKVTDIALETRAENIETLKAAAMDGATVGDKLLEMVAKIGEKIDITKLEIVKAEAVVPYIHGNYRIGVLVGLDKATSEGITAAGRDVAMQIAAMNPLAKDENSIAQETIDRERNIIIDTMKADPKMEGKPDEMIGKIAEGKLNAFFKENTLMAQPFVKDASKTVANYLKETEGGLTVTDFRRVAIG